MNKTKRNHDVHVAGKGKKCVIVHIQNGTMTLDEAGRLALDLAKAVSDAQPPPKVRQPAHSD